ncbi:MAG: 30S ribosomal protein S2 [Acidobacteria bacterium]|nr:30S ribosomal protein S2 [Acidobacteriota bacterium]
MDSATSVSLRELLEAGAHFGHQRSRWNPRMRPYIFGLRGGVYVIDLQKTVVLLQEAMNFLRELTAQGKIVLFVGTKRQAQEIVIREAQRCEMFYVHQRWLGGLLTNWATVKRSIDKLRDLDNLETDQRFSHLTKKERLKLTKTRSRLDKVLAGIKEMGRRPDALFIVDTSREYIAVQEANRLGLPVIGLVDTNGDPTVIDYPIPANDDAIRSIELFASRAADSILEGRNQWRAARPERTARPARRQRGGGREAEPAPVPAPAPEPAEAPPVEPVVGPNVVGRAESDAPAPEEQG